MSNSEDHSYDSSLESSCSDYEGDCHYKYNNSKSSGSIKSLRRVRSTRSESDIFNLHDRGNMRDVLLLQRYKVPFKYDEVACCSNERFRDIKATPGLTMDQINVMLDARRRATNRQAAERCRKLKLMAKGRLSDQLIDLRQERQLLTKKLTEARCKRQKIRDNLYSEEQRLLCSLIDPNGNKLEPSKWRVHSTIQGDVVITAAPSICSDQPTSGWNLETSGQKSSPNELKYSKIDNSMKSSRHDTNPSRRFRAAVL